MTRDHPASGDRLARAIKRRIARLERAAIWHELQFQVARQRGDDEAAIRHHDEMTACRMALVGVAAGI
jgi:hypothetical protein